MTQHTTDPASDLVAGRYEVQRIVARGGMGVVYLAQQVLLNRPVALKVLAPPVDAEDSGDFEERFRLEAETLAALDHRNIVTLYDYGQMRDGRFFLALEFIDGPRYTDLLRSGTLSVERAVALLLQVCGALRYAHKRGVVHRDLKPSNLLIRKEDDGVECVKVVDFGLVKVMEQDHEITRAGLILGSPHCMAPEQIQSQPVDHRVDIYALGVLLFRSITGKWPYHAESGTATMVAHIKDPVPYFHDKAPGIEVPPRLEAIVRKCLSKRPEDRYPDVTALMLELSSCMGWEPGAALTGTVSLGGSGGARPLTPASEATAPSVVTAPTLTPPTDEPSAPPAVQRRKLPVVALVLAALAFVVLSGVGAWAIGNSLRRANPEPESMGQNEAPPVDRVVAPAVGSGTEAPEAAAEDAVIAAEVVKEEVVEPEAVEEPRVRTPRASTKASNTTRQGATKTGTKAAGDEAGSNDEAADTEAPPEGYMGLPDDF